MKERCTRPSLTLASRKCALQQKRLYIGGGLARMVMQLDSAGVMAGPELRKKL